MWVGPQRNLIFVKDQAWFPTFKCVKLRFSSKIQISFITKPPTVTKFMSSGDKRFFKGRIEMQKQLRGWLNKQ